MQYLSSLTGFAKRHAAGILPAGAITGVLVASLLVAPSSILGLGTSYGYGSSCISATIAATPVQPQHEGTGVSLKASSTGCGLPEYKFYLQAPGGAWTAVSPFGGDTYGWVTDGAQDGVWGIGVWVRQIGSAAIYQAYYIGTYSIQANCTSAKLTTSPTTPRPQGTTVLLTGSSTGCNNTEYRYWVLTRNGTHWSSFGPYSSTTTVTWDTTNYAIGPTRLGVWARQIGSIHGYDTYSIITFQIT